MATSVMLNPWVDRTYNFQEPTYFYGPKNIWAHRNFLDTYNLRGMPQYDLEERKDISEEFDCVSRNLGLSRIDKKRHYKKDSRFVLDLYTLTYGSTETLDSIGDLSEASHYQDILVEASFNKDFVSSSTVDNEAICSLDQVFYTKFNVPTNFKKDIYCQRRNDREEIRKRLANGTDTESPEKGGRRKPNLQTRLQNGMNLQICFMNETMSDDNESPNSDSEPKSLPPNKNKSCHVSSNRQPQSLSCHISNTNKTSTKPTTRPSPASLSLPLKPAYPGSRPLTSVADFFARQAELQAEARRALSESKVTAARLMQEERETQPVSPITEIIRSSLAKVGITFPKDRRRLSRQLLTDMNVTQLQVIVNDLHTQIEYLNEKLVRYLMERDELHMSQDSMLVDIEDLTRYLSAKQKTLKQESIQNNNSTMFGSLKPQMNRIATLVKK